MQNFGTIEAEVQCKDNTLHSFHSPHQLAEDAHGSHLVNFPFAFAVFMMLMTGLTAIGWGIIVTNAWPAAVGFLTMLVGCFLYGWSLHDD